MLLVTAATEDEIKPLEEVIGAAMGMDVLVVGMGPVAAAANLSRYLTLHGSSTEGVLNIGVAGAYVGSGLAILDICLAQQEFLGDFGICMQDGIRDFGADLHTPGISLLFNNKLAQRLVNILQSQNIAFKTANFVTVNCCSGTEKRGDFLRKKFGAGCENMEGAAVAMVCNSFNIPCAELRCVSNMVQDRDVTTWQLTAAIEKICRTAEAVIREYHADRSSGA